MLTPRINGSRAFLPSSRAFCASWRVERHNSCRCVTCSGGVFWGPKKKSPTVVDGEIRCCPRRFIGMMENDQIWGVAHEWFLKKGLAHHWESLALQTAITACFYAYAYVHIMYVICIYLDIYNIYLDGSQLRAFCRWILHYLDETV